MKQLKKILALSALSLSLAAPMALASGSQQLLVTGMTCRGCAESVKKAFLKNPEVKDVSVDVKSGKVVLTLQPEKTLSEEQIRKTVEGVGFKLKPDSRG